MDYEIKLDQFQGPLDLLLFLIRKNRIDICDIPIALITEQYLQYLGIIRSLNLDEAGEYLVLAATLLQIKSRMLLPVPEGETEEDEGDPRQELVNKLLEYQVFKEAASALETRPVLERDVFERGFHEEDAQGDPSDDGILIEAGIFDLLEAFREAIEGSGKSESMEIDLEKISLADRINEIMDVLTKCRSLTFVEFLDSSASKRHIIYTFLAILELIKLRMIKAFQNETSGVIRIFLAVDE
ncbi:MAG: segregation/condensation protein A [Syntrophales bacterium]